MRNLKWFKVQESNEMRLQFLSTAPLVCKPVFIVCLNLMIGILPSKLLLQISNLVRTRFFIEAYKPWVAGQPRFRLRIAVQSISIQINLVSFTDHQLDEGGVLSAVLSPCKPHCLRVKLPDVIYTALTVMINDASFAYSSLDVTSGTVTATCDMSQKGVVEWVVCNISRTDPNH